MEALCCLLKRAKVKSFFPSWRVNSKGGEVEISHILLADDTLVLCELTQDQLTCLHYLCGLRPFQGLALNWKR